jgi:manganese/zinc/iron transport system permease protein
MTALWHILADPWTPASLRVYWPILAEGALVSLALGLIGCFLVVRGLSLLGDALSHSVLPGIVIGFLLGGSLHSPWILVGATAVGVAAALLVQGVQHHSRVKEDASLGIVFTSLFALGVVMINLYAGQADLDPGCVLYGNIEYMIFDHRAIATMAVIVALVVAGLLLFYRHLLVSTFDPGLAVSLGIPAAAVHYALMGALSLTVVASFEAVGAILAVALLVMPGATARLWTDRMPTMLLAAAGHGVASTLLGFWLSHPDGPLRGPAAAPWGGTSASGAICVAGFALFLVSWLVAPRHGLLPRWRVRRRLARVMAMENLLKAVEDRAGGTNAPVAEAALATELHVPAGVLRTVLARATGRGWVTGGPGGVALTAAGRAQSQRLVRAHELWEQYLRHEVGLEPDHVHDAAEWIEHYLNDESIEHLDRLLAKPKGEAS